MNFASRQPSIALQAHRPTDLPCEAWPGITALAAEYRVSGSTIDRAVKVARA